jgi:hypothetical protein
MTTDASSAAIRTGPSFERDKTHIQVGHRQHIEAEVVHNSGGEQVVATDSSFLHVCHPYLDWPGSRNTDAES